MDIKINKPYPEVKASAKNQEYARMLLQEYSGNISENTVTHLYLYQSFILKQTYPEISNILKSIAITEMKHLSLLGEAILMLGLKPIYGTIEGPQIHYWNGVQVDYSSQLKQILKIDIQTEMDSIRNYQESIHIIQDSNLQKLLERILEDERLHLQVFQELYHKNF